MDINFKFLLNDHSYSIFIGEWLSFDYFAIWTQEVTIMENTIISMIRDSRINLLNESLDAIYYGLEFDLHQGSWEKGLLLKWFTCTQMRIWWETWLAFQLQVLTVWILHFNGVKVRTARAYLLSEAGIQDLFQLQPLLPLGLCQDFVQRINVFARFMFKVTI